MMQPVDYSSRLSPIANINYNYNDEYRYHNKRGVDKLVNIEQERRNCKDENGRNTS